MPPFRPFSVAAAFALLLPASGRGEETPVGPSTEPDLRVLSTRSDGVVRVRLAPGLLASGRLPRPADAPEGAVPAAFRLHRLLPSLDPDLETSESGPHEIAGFTAGEPEADVFAGDEGFPPGPWRITLHAVTDGVPADAEIAGARFWRGRVEDWAAGIEGEYASLRALLDQWKGAGDPADEALLIAAEEYRWFTAFPIHLRNRFREESDAAFRADFLAGRVTADPPADADSKRKLTPRAAEKLEAGAAGAGKGPAVLAAPADDKHDLLARTAMAHILLAAEEIASRAAACPELGRGASPEPGRGAADVRLRDLSSSAPSALTDWTCLAGLHERCLAADPAYRRISAALRIEEFWKTVPADAPESAAAGAWKTAFARAGALRAGISGKS